MAFGLGGSSGSTKSTSESQSSSVGFDIGQTYLDPQQQFNQQQLINRYMNQFPQLGATPGLAFNQGQVLPELYGTGNQAQLLGNRAQSLGIQGMQGLGQFARQGNPYLQQQIAGLAQDAGQFYREQLLPGIGSQAQLAGQRGSSRQGIAEGLAGQRVGQEFLQAASNLRANAYGQQQQAAQALAGLGLGTAGQAYGTAGNIFGQQGQLANLFAQTGLQAQFQPFQIGAQVIGAPQLLSQQFGYDTSESWSKSRSKGKTASLNLGIG